MLKQKLGAITQNTLIPIGFVLVLLSGAIYVGRLAQAVDNIIDKDSPSRSEFNKLSDDTTYIRQRIDQVVLKAQANNVKIAPKSEITNE